VINGKETILQGATMEEMMANGRKVAQDLLQGKIPSGTTASEWMIIHGVAVYFPYFPLYQTPDLVNDHDAH